MIGDLGECSDLNSSGTSSKEMLTSNASSVERSFNNHQLNLNKDNQRISHTPSPIATTD